MKRSEIKSEIEALMADAGVLESSFGVKAVRSSTQLSLVVKGRVHHVTFESGLTPATVRAKLDDIRRWIDARRAGQIDPEDGLRD